MGTQIKQSNLDAKVELQSTFSENPVSDDKRKNRRKPLPSRHDKLKGIRKPCTDDHLYQLPQSLRSSNEDLRIRALYNFWDFIDLLGFKGGRKEFSDIHKDMSHFFTQTQLIDNKKRRRLGLVPRGHLKSTLGTVAYVLWRLYRNPNLRVCVATATKPLALQFVREIKQYFEDADLQDNVWNKRPHVEGRMIPILDKAGFSRRNQKWDLGDYTEAEDKKVVWRADAIQLIRSELYKEPSVIAASPGSTITGMHFDLMILDDIINDETTATQEKIDKTLRWAQDLESIIDPTRRMSLGNIKHKEIWELIGDELLVWGTRYAKGDFYEFLLENLEDFEYSLFFRNIYVNGEDSSEGYIWRERFNNENISRIRKRQGLIRFSSQYLNKVIVSEEIVLDVDKINYLTPSQIDKESLGRSMVRIYKKDQKPIDIFTYLVIDPAISQKKTADNSVIMVGGIDSDFNLYILDYKSGKMLPDKLIENTFELADKWNLDVVQIEVVSFQQALIYMFRNSFKDYRPIALREYRPKGDKKARIESHLQPIVFNGQLYLMTWMKGMTNLMDEFSYFPSKVAHDDHLDAMSMIVENAKPTTSGDTRKRRIYDHFRVNNRYGGRVR